MTVSGEADITSLKTATTTQGSIYYVDSAGHAAALGPGTSGQVLKTQGASANPVWDSESAITVATDTEPLLAALDSEDSTANTTYIKVKEITLNQDSVLYVTFSLKNTNAGDNAYGRIYKNGVAYGTERSMTGSSYVDFSESLSFSKGDNLQLYIRTSNSDNYAWSNKLELRGTMIGTINDS